MNRPGKGFMSAVVKTSGNQCACIRSALPQSSDVSGARRYFAFVPGPDIGHWLRCRADARGGARSAVTFARRPLFARVTARLHFLDLLHDLIEIVARRILQRREVDVGLEFLEPSAYERG
jgi:hypothetical protein